MLYKDWRYNLKQEFLELEEKGVDDPYSHPPSGVSLEDWKYLIDVAWKDESHLVTNKLERPLLKLIYVLICKTSSLIDVQLLH